MHTNQPGAPARPSPSSSHATERVLREARRLHRAATSNSLCMALPVLRRVLATHTVPRTPLPDLFRRRHSLQRKHLLRTLAVEAGFESWEAYRPTLDDTPLSALDALEVVHRGTGQLKLWFSNEREAKDFTARHGGRPVKVGSQAVVLPAKDEPV